jgi:two-component system, LuxR family, sensor histidine kinase DctS
MHPQAVPIGRRAALVSARVRPWLWALPLVLALLLLGGVAAWLQVSDQRDLEERERTLLGDALSLEQQLRKEIDFERERLVDIARQADAGHWTPTRLAADADVSAGLRRRWVSLTWLDARGQVRVQVPDGAASAPERRGMTYHLTAPMADGGQLLARYALQPLLTQQTPWWINRRYAVRLVDEFDETLAIAADATRAPSGRMHRISFDPPVPGVWLELAEREAFVPWYRALPLPLLGAVLALLVWATWLLARQVRQVERTQTAWRDEAAWRRAMEDSLSVGLRVRDAEGRLLHVNPRFVELTGYTEAELLGRAPPMPYWHPDEMDEAWTRHHRNLAGHAPRAGYEARWRTQAGRDLWVMILEAPLIDAAGAQIGWMGSVVDITERKQAEELERRRNERLADQARLMTVGEIASSLAHELNQPLAAIASYNAGLQNALASLPDVPPRLREALERQAEQARHAGRIVQRIRAFLGRRAPQHEACDLVAITDSAVALLRHDLRRQQVQVQVQHMQTALPVQADPVLIEQVVINLLRNGADAQAERGDTASPGTAARLSVCTDVHDGQARVSVLDAGPGLGGHSMDELTAPFFSTKASGMGLGLAISRSIIEAHRGRLLAQDVSGSGACFSFSLPLAGCSNPSPAPGVGADAEGGAGERSAAHV